MSFICAANWKMNLSYQQASEFLTEFNEKTKSFKSASLDPNLKLKSPFCFFPQAVHAPLFKDQKNLNWGAQDFYFESSGAFTGQNSPDLFKELGANIMLIGHSERRTLFGETNAIIAKKIQKSISLNLTPMLCVGETLDERKKGQTLDVLKKQLNEGLLEKPSSLIIAYEPVWAIGTGMTATTQDVQEAHNFIKEQLGFYTPVLYGGSVKPENAKELSSIDSVNGFLIGGASLKVDSFLSIYNNSI